MGFFRKVESGIERAVGGVFGRAYTGHVEPPELAVKLVKEMEDHKLASLSRTYAPNLYTIFLCPDDRNHFSRYERSLGSELAEHLHDHARRQGLTPVARIVVGFETDPDLKRGQFGIRAEMEEKAAAALASQKPAAMDRQDPAAWSLAGGGPLSTEPARDAARIEGPATAPERAVEAEAAPRLGVPVVANLAGAGRPVGLETESIPPEIAAKMDLARQTIVLREGSREQEFEKGRVVLGRGRQVDFQLDDPNVSRRHAAVYWENGRLFVKDLGSTNGTLLNGRPVTAGPVSRGDVITLGGSEIVVETG